MDKLKTKLFISCLLLGFLSGCIPYSLQPFYKEDDSLLDQRLPGAWQEEESKNIWEFRENKEQNRYEFILREEEKPPETFEARLFKIKDIYYIDFEVNDEAKKNGMDGLMFPVHIVYEVRFYEDALGIVAYGWDFEKIGELVRRKKARLSYVKIDGDHVLTSPTEELQDFLKKFVNNEKHIVFEKHEVILKRTTTDSEGMAQ